MENKKLFVLATLFLSSIFLMSVANAACPSGMTSYWKLDGDATDSFNGNDGTISGATSTSGQVDSALDFDGNDYVNIAGKMQFAANDKITIMAWVFTGPSTHEEVFGGCNDPNNNCDGQDYDGLVLRRTGTGLSYADPNKLMFGIYYSRSVGGRSYCFYVSNNDVPFNQWVHVAAVYDPNNNDAGTKLYINGQSVSRSRTCSNPQPRTISIYPSIGALAWGNNRISGHSNYFDGIIDEVAIHNRALSAGEIYELYKKGSTRKDYCYSECTLGETSCAGTNYLTCDDGLSWTDNGEVEGYCGVSASACPSGMISYWKLDETSGNTASDSIGNNDGTLRNNPIWATGQVGNALRFDGNDDYIDLNDDNSLNLGDTWTLMEWIYPESLTTENNAIIIHYDTSEITQNEYYVSGPQQNKIAYYSVEMGTSAVSITKLSENNWYHTAITYDNGNVNFYLNGQPDGGTTGYTTGDWDGGTKEISHSGTEPFNGIIDEVSIYNRALTPTEIKDQYDNGLIRQGYCCQCSSGPCCDGCNFRPSTYECRAAVGDCDAVETCTGTSPDCPGDILTAAGESCGTCMECDASGNCNSIGNYNYRKGEIIDTNDYACCDSNTDCVYNNICYDEGAPHELDGETAYCDDGEWRVTLEPKCDWDNDECGYCDDTQCMNPQGQCVNDKDFILDHFCENGKWTTRTKLIALQLLDISDQTSPEDYTLFCDSYENTLNYYQYIISDITVTQHLTEVNNICVLKLPDQVIFGTSLKQPINQGQFMKTLTDVDDCDDAMDDKEDNDGNFHQCNSGSSRAWYNNKTQSVIYSNKNILDNPPEFEINAWEAFLTFLKNPFQTIFNSLFKLFEEKTEYTPEDYEFIEDTKEFSRIYLNRKNVKSIMGIAEEVGKRGEYISVTYSEYSEDVCATINMVHEKFKKEGQLGEKYLFECHYNPSTRSYYFASNSSIGIALWPELTARLRPRGVCPYIIAPTRAIVDYPITFNVDIDWCGDLELNYSWNFGDGTTCPPDCGDGDKENPIHNYTTLGEKNVTLTVTNDDGMSKTATLTINVVVPGDCEVRTDCGGDLCVLSLSDTTDAHATEDCGGFGYKLCCPNIYKLDSGCQAEVISLSDPVDGHADAPEVGSFTNTICVKSKDTSKTATCSARAGDCNSDEQCLISLSNTYDAHVSGCENTLFGTKMCCKIGEESSVDMTCVSVWCRYPNELIGDFNEDGEVDMGDFGYFADHVGETPDSPGWDGKYDLNGDGVVDEERDKKIWEGHYECKKI